MELKAGHVACPHCGEQTRSPRASSTPNVTVTIREGSLPMMRQQYRTWCQQCHRRFWHVRWLTMAAEEVSAAKEPPADESVWLR